MTWPAGLEQFCCPLCSTALFACWPRADCMLTACWLRADWVLQAMFVVGGRVGTVEPVSYVEQFDSARNIWVRGARGETFTRMGRACFLSVLASPRPRPGRVGRAHCGARAQPHRHTAKLNVP